MSNYAYIKTNLYQVQEQITRAAQAAGRSLSQVTLVAVTKTHPAPMLDAVLEAGIADIGENKVQEASQKLPMLANQNYNMHFIGHLQSNKINALLQLNPCLIHSIDKISTLTKLNSRLQSLNRTQRVLVQVNTSNEDSKSGIEPAELEEFLQQVTQLEHIEVAGLMTIGALTNNQTIVKGCFDQLARLRDTAAAKVVAPNINLEHLSMGMSSDFELAIACGATLLRIGSLILGQRDYGANK